MSQEISQPGQRQAEKLAEVGAYLRQVREEQFLSIEQVATQTLIQPRLLKAIEAGDLTRLPEPVYIQGFIKRYAEALGLNGMEFAHAFPTEPDLHTIQPSWKDSPAAQLRPIHLYAFYVVLIIAAVSGLSYLLSRSAPWVSRPPETETAAVSPDANNTEETTQSSPESPPSATSDSSNTEPSSSPSPQAEALKVDLKLTAQSWLRITVDGKKEFEGVLQEGAQQTWTARNELTVRAGNAGGVMLAHNGGNAEPMGEPGAVREVTFSVSNQDAASLPQSE